MLESFASGKRGAPDHEAAQLTLFQGAGSKDRGDAEAVDELADRISTLDVDRMTPLEALDFLSGLVKSLRNER
jgi:hypothetical protein